jgi:CheY-like chemotaxis protein
MKQAALYKKPSIFIADDDDDDVYFVRTALKELDPEIRLRHFLNGRQLLKGLDVAPEEYPNLILLDLNMPILDGRETLKQIRQKVGNAIPVVILSTSNHEHEKEICLQAGANSYFTKPCNYPLYLQIIKKLKAEWIDKVLV